MKALFIYLFIYLCILKVSAQTNLVPNPSFEDTIHCPTSISQLYNCALWINPNFAGPDYYNSCADYSTTFVSVPNNAFGYQQARTGDAYVGLLLYQRTTAGGPFDFREYIQIQLLDSLEQGKTYCVAFYINYSSFVTNIAIDNIGLYVSDTAVNASTPTALPYLPQIVSPDGVFLTDTLNWYKVEGTFIASGGERYITIGNFKDENNTDTIQTDSFPASAAYYYIDDVSVICCDCDTIKPPPPPPPKDSSSLTMPNIFTPNNDHNNDFFKPIIKNIITLNCKIYNRWGLLVGELKDVNDVWDGRTTAGVECSDGVYYYLLTAKGEDGKEYDEKGFLQLVR